jgi:hypothetical protein
MIQTGKVVHRQVEFEGCQGVHASRAFEATCFVSAHTGDTFIMRYTDRSAGDPAFADPRLSQYLGKTVTVKANGLAEIQGYPYLMLVLNPAEPIKLVSE